MNATSHATVTEMTPAIRALNSTVTIFDSAWATTPDEQIVLSDLLDRVEVGTWAASISPIRRLKAAGSDKEYNDAKRGLPAFTMSGRMLTRDAQKKFEERFVQHSGVLQCDFDSKDNPHMRGDAALADAIAALKTDPHVLFGFISPSGVGLKCGVLIDGARHLDSFLSAERYFMDKYALQIDRSTKDPVRICFVSFDEGLWRNKEATQLPVLIQPTAPRMDTWHPPIETTVADIREMLRFVAPRPEYSDWIRIASAVWSKTTMEDGCRLLMEWSPEEKAGEYASKWSHRLVQIGVGTLVHYAVQGGFDAKAAARRKQWAGRIRFAEPNKLGGDQASEDAAQDPAPNVQPVELDREFLYRCLENQQNGDAELFAALASGHKLYDHLAQVWRTYRNGVWERDQTRQTLTESVTMLREAYEKLRLSVAQDMAQEPAPEKKKDARVAIITGISDRQKKLQTLNWITSVMRFAESKLHSVATQFDQRPHLMCVQNGVIDFADGSFREHRTSDMLSITMGIPFNPDAECPRWLAFLDFAMGGDKDMMAFLARAVGYSLTGFVDKDCLFFLYGQGANGKSTFTAVLKMLGGELMTTISIDALLARASDNNFDYKKAMLEGKRIVVTDEIPENRTLNDSAIKSLVGGDEITARRPYEKPYVFSPTHKLWLVGNHKPDIKGVDYGIWRRILLIPWAHMIPEDKRRPRHEVLAEMRAELPGILNWAIRGYIDMIEGGGLRPPGAVVAATKEYKQDSDQFSQFISERLQKTDEIMCEQVSCKEILHAYLAWCEDNGEEPRLRTGNKVTRALKDLGYAITKGRDNMNFAKDVRLNRA